MALASQSLVSEWLLAKSILGKKYGTRTQRDIDTIVPWLRDRGEIFTALSEGAHTIPYNAYERLVLYCVMALFTIIANHHYSQTIYTYIMC